MNLRIWSFAAMNLACGLLVALLPVEGMAQSFAPGIQARSGGSAVWFPGSPVFVCFPDGSPTRVRCERAAIPVPASDIKDVQAVRFNNESSGGWLLTTSTGYMLCAMQRSRPRTHCVSVNLPLIYGSHFEVVRQQAGGEKRFLALRFLLPAGAKLDVADTLSKRISSAFQRSKSELELILKSNAVAASAERSMSSLTISSEEDDPPRLDPVEIVGIPIFEDGGPSIPPNWFFPEPSMPIDDSQLFSDEYEKCMASCYAIYTAAVKQCKRRPMVLRPACYGDKANQLGTCQRGCPK